MNRFFKAAILSVAVGATTIAAIPAANARDWHRWDRHHHRHSNGDALAAGVVGLAAGALIAGALSQPRSDYYEPDYVVRRAPPPRPAPVREYYPASYRGSIEPWSPEWYNYCSDRYQSFNARTGTFMGYDGEQHFCVAN